MSTPLESGGMKSVGAWQKLQTTYLPIKSMLWARYLLYQILRLPPENDHAWSPTQPLCQYYWTYRMFLAEQSPSCTAATCTSVYNYKMSHNKAHVKALLPDGEWHNDYTQVIAISQPSFFLKGSFLKRPYLTGSFSLHSTYPYSRLKVLFYLKLESVWSKWSTYQHFGQAHVGVKSWLIIYIQSSRPIRPFPLYGNWWLNIRARLYQGVLGNRSRCEIGKNSSTELPFENFGN